MASKSEQLAQVLSALKKTAGVEGSVLLSRDGITVVADLPARYNRDTFSAMSAAMLGAAETAMVEIGKNAPDRLILENDGTRIIATGVTADLMVVVLAGASVNVAQLGREIKAIGDAIRKIVG